MTDNSKRRVGTWKIRVERDRQTIETVTYENAIDFLGSDTTLDVQFAPNPGGLESVFFYGESPLGPLRRVSYHAFNEPITVNADEELQVTFTYHLQDPSP